MTGPALRIDAPQTDTSEAGSRTDLTAVERTHILQVLHETGWRIRGAHGAAAHLGLKPTTLESRIRKLGLSRPGTGALLRWMVGNLAAWSTLVETLRSAV